MSFSIEDFVDILTVLHRKGPGPLTLGGIQVYLLLIMIIIINKDLIMTENRTKPILKLWEDSIHQHGYRVTRPRLQVMEIITSSDRPLTPQEIYQQSLGLDDPPGIASVYRTLEMLDGLGLIQQVHQPGGCHGIWPAIEGHKHYLICRACGQMRVIDGSEAMNDYIDSIEQKTGYQVEEHWLQFFGLCEGCLN